MTRPRIRLLVRATACALLAVGVHVLAAPAAGAPVSGTLVASPAGAVMAAEQVTLDGSLPPARARSVRLQRRIDAGAWTVVESKQSRTNGTFRFTPAVPASGATQVSYRVYAPAATLGGRFYGETETPTVTLDVVPQLSSLHVPSRVLVGTTYTVEAIFSPARAGRSVVLQRRSGGSWTNLATTTQNAAGVAVFARPASTTGTSTLRAMAQKYRGAVAQTTTTSDVSVLSSGDVTPPAVPAGLRATYDSARVELSWDAVPDGDLAGYRVYRASSQNGPWVPLTSAPVTTTRYVDSSTADPTAYRYTVTSTDTFGNESGRALAVQPTQGDLTAPAVPTGLAAQAGDGKATVSWSAGPDADLAGYQLYRAETAGGPWVAVGGSTTTTSATVSGLTNDLTYFFTVTSLDTTGNESGRSPAVQATPQGSNARLAAGRAHTCRITEGAALSCWGDNDDGQLGTGTTEDSATPAPVGSGSDWVAVAAGARHTCAIRAAGTLWCWGSNDSGQLGDGTTTRRTAPVQVGSGTSWVRVAAGGGHTCGVRADGTALCWGDNDSGQLGDGTTTRRTTPVQVGTDADWRVLTAGSSSTCGVRTGGAGWCWGANEDGQLGDGTLTSRSTPVRVGDASLWKAITTAVTGTHTCGVRADGTAWCWGNGSQGQLGNGGGSSGRSATPVQVGTESDWAELAPGGSHTCGLRTDRATWCWGDNYYGQLGDGTTADRAVPVQVGTASEWSRVAAGSQHTCGLLPDGAVRCWGNDDRGQLGTGSTPRHSTPAQVGTATSWGEVTSGAGHTCAVRLDGSAWCWGSNAAGELGVGDRTDRAKPARVGAGNDWDMLTAGDRHTCGVRGDGTAWCWGADDTGQLGTGDTSSTDAPLQVGTGTSWTTLTAGTDHTCGTHSDGTAWCWGGNATGQLGTGDTSNTDVPVQVGSAADWTSLVAGGHHTCGTRSDGTAWCWGANATGQLGTGDTSSTDAPVQVGSAADWTSLAAGGHHTCGLRDDRTAFCWGDNSGGQVGDGTTDQRLEPTQVAGTGDWAQLTAGGHSCGVQDDGTAWCWGPNVDGQLGDGSTTDRTVPVRVGTDLDWDGLSAGRSHTCATRVGGTTWCWGRNDRGQLGYASWLTQPHAPPGPEPDDGTTEPAGAFWLDRTLTDDAIRESSGLALSSYDPTLLWTHNDSGGSATIFAVTKAGGTQASYTVGATTNRDWEDISSGPGRTLWVGDIGDNNRVRPSVTVHRVVEPENPVGGTLRATSYTLTYPDGPQNAETLMVNPVDGRLYVVSKTPAGTPGAIYVAPATLSTTGTNPLTRLGAVPSRITAGDWAPDGESFMIRTPTEGYLYSSLDDTPTQFVLPAMRQGESLAYSTKPSVVYLGSEGLDSPVYGMSTGISDDGATRSTPPEPPPPPRAPAPAPVLGIDLGWSPTAPTVPDNGVVHPEDFGAVGDGTTDDSAALQAAVDQAAAVGASVELAPDTTYRLESQLLLPSRTYLHGAGSSSVLAFTWTQNDDFHDGMYLGNKDQTVGNTDITLDSFAILGAANGEPAGPKSMQAFPNVPAIRFRLVDRFQISRLEISNAAGISLLNQGCSNGTIHENHVHHSGRDGINTGWFRQGGHHIVVAHNLITKVGDDGIAILGANGDGTFTDVWTHHVAAVGNTVQGWATNINGLAIGRGISVLGVEDSDVVDNVVDMTHSNGILVGPAVDQQNNVVYRSADVRFVGNTVANAGQLYVGSDPAIHEPGHEGVLANRSDRISFVSTTITNSYGQPMLFDRCTCTTT